MSSAFGQSMNSKAIARKQRSPRQNSVKFFFQHLVQIWRSLSTSQKNAWIDWVAFLPQHTLHSETRFIAPFQNFVKRNWYLLFVANSAFPPLLSPVLVEYSIDNFIAVARITDNRLYLDLTFERGNGDLQVSIFVSYPSSTGTSKTRGTDRFCAHVSNINQSVDITDHFLANFGVLPQKGSDLLFRVIEMGTDNGQFFYPEVPRSGVDYGKTVRFGCLYNFETAMSEHQFFADGWGLPSNEMIGSMLSAVGNMFYRGYHMRDTDPAFWYEGENLGDNSSGFSARGSGYINMTPEFAEFLYAQFIMGAITTAPDQYYACKINGSSDLVVAGSLFIAWQFGISVRPFKWYEGETQYTDANGNVYPVINIGGVAVTSLNLIQTKFFDGSIIPLIPSIVDWAATSGEKMAYPAFNVDNAWQ